MRKFILSILVFGFIILVSIVAFFYMADGSTDAMYLKFTTPQQSALIIGSSRAAQGIHPEKINTTLQRDDVYNYAFQIPTSPYGEAYFNSIKRKINPNTKNGLFILEVNPWTIGLRKDSITNEEYLSEAKGFLANTNRVSMNPNFEYLIESYNGSYINILKDRNRKGAYQTLFVEDDGWLHVTIESDMISREDRTALKIKTYRKDLNIYHGVSQYRKDYLIKTIAFLKAYGNVYLVRIPVIDDMLQIEKDLQPNFENQMQQIAKDNEIQFINMMPNLSKYSYTDGNHLDVSSGEQFSIDLANNIRALNQQ